jgi:integrase
VAIRKIERQNGRIVYQVDTYDSTGTRVRRNFPRLKQAQAFEREPILAAVAKTQSARVRDITFSQAATEYLDWVQTNKAPATYRSYVDVVRPLVSMFGAKRLSRITPEMIEEHKKRRMKEVGNRTVNGDIGRMKAVFDLAIQKGHAHHNPCDKIAWLRLREPKIKALTLDQIRRVLVVAEGFEQYPLIITAAHTGLRRQELFSLTWDDVDFDEGVIHVANAKNYKRRVINITEEMREALLFARAGHTRKHDCVFESRGKPLKFNIDGTLKKIAAEAGVPRFSLHSFRHTFATHLAAAGVDGHQVQKSLGHKRFSSTERYMDLAQGSYRSANSNLQYGRYREREDEN